MQVLRVVHQDVPVARRFLPAEQVRGPVGELQVRRLPQSGELAGAGRRHTALAYRLQALG